MGAWFGGLSQDSAKLITCITNTVAQAERCCKLNMIPSEAVLVGAVYNKGLDVRPHNSKLSTKMIHFMQNSNILAVEII